MGKPLGLLAPQVRPCFARRLIVNLGNLGKKDDRASTGRELLFEEQRTMIALSRRFIIVVAVALVEGPGLAALSWAQQGGVRGTAGMAADPPKVAETGKKGEEKKKGLPLVPDRTIEFTASEGTWVSLDISPDGKTVVFELLGDLHTVSIEGGEAKSIASGLAFDGQPKFSPDGKIIAFVTDRSSAENLWTCRADGSDPRAVTKDEHAYYTSPSWTPEGDYILISKQPQQPFGAFELWMYHKRGGAGVQVTKPGCPWKGNRLTKRPVSIGRKAASICQLWGSDSNGEKSNELHRDSCLEA
jgi:hypothetical protein